MIIPVRCFTCNKVIADKWEQYMKKCTEMEKSNGEEAKYFTEPFKKKILDDLGLTRYCCRRHMLGHVDIIDNL